MSQQHEVDDSSFAALVCSVVRVPNPQQSVDGAPGEQRLLDSLCAWFERRKVPYVTDPSWGVHAVVTGRDGAGECPGVLLSAHLDSDHLDVSDLSGVRADGQLLVCPGQVGLDCKTGVAMCLSVLMRLQAGDVMPPTFQVHVLFTTGEESGQKGAIRAPLAHLIGGRVRHAIVLDRMTRGSNAPVDARGQPVRHAVTEYKGVPLLDSCAGPELLEHLSIGLAQATGGAPRALPSCVSPNCADALELRGRWDAEFAARQLTAGAAAVPAVSEALRAYEASTRQVVERLAAVAAEVRVSSMNAPPRISRYQAMAKVHAAIAPLVPAEPRLWFSCVNLSYDYDDDWDTCSLRELDMTAQLVECAVRSYYTAVRFIDADGDRVQLRLEPPRHDGRRQLDRLLQRQQRAAARPGASTRLGAGRRGGEPARRRCARPDRGRATCRPRQRATHFRAACAARLRARDPASGAAGNRRRGGAGATVRAAHGTLLTGKLNFRTTTTPRTRRNGSSRGEVQAEARRCSRRVRQKDVVKPTRPVTSSTGRHQPPQVFVACCVVVVALGPS